MTYAVPDIPYAFGSRAGATALYGSLNPQQDSPISRVGARIDAWWPLGVITTTTSWGFVAGAAPTGTTALVVAANGRTFERAVTQTYGGYAAATASISITVEEFFNNSFVRSVTSTPTPVINIWSAVLGIQGHARFPGTAAPVLLTGVTAGRVYRCWVNAIQSATVQGVSGYGYAASNFVFDFLPVYFSFM